MAHISEFSSFLQKTKLDAAALAMREGQKSVLLIDYCRVRDKYDFVRELGAGLRPHRLFVLDGVTAPPAGVFENTTFINPPQEIYYLSKLALPSAGVHDLLEIPEEFEGIVKLFKLHAGQMNEYVDLNIIRNCIRTAYLYSLFTMRMLNPELVMIWNAFHPLSQCAEKAARLSGIPVCYAEFGALPGSMNVDFIGQMGESAVVQEAEIFDRLPLTQADMDNARLALQVFRETGANRRIQAQYGESDFAEKVRKAAAGRPIVFFAGHNDLASGMYPYTEHTKRFHSPIFSSSGEAGKAMAQIAAENGWFLLYKPHPMFQPDGRLEHMENVFRVGDVNINECIDVSDVTCTVLSQVSYIARIRNKPVVMLGYNQMRGKNVAYEADKIEDIPAAVDAAIKEQSSEEKEEAWVRHVALLLRHHLYLWGNETYGITWRDPQQLASHIRKMAETGTFRDFLDSPDAHSMEPAQI